MSSLTIQTCSTSHEQILPKPAWPVYKPPLRLRIARALTRCYGTAGKWSLHR